MYFVFFSSSEYDKSNGYKLFAIIIFFSILFFFRTVNALSHYSARKLAVTLKPVKKCSGTAKKTPDFAWLKKIAFQRYTVSQKRLKRLQKFSNITGSGDKDLANKQPNLPFILSMEDRWPHTNILKPTLGEWVGGTCESAGCEGVSVQLAKNVSRFLLYFVPDVKRLLWCQS